MRPCRGSTPVEVDLQEFELTSLPCGELIIFVIRPLSEMLSLIYCHQHWTEKAEIAFFGVRGLGSVYYPAFAFGHAQFDNVKVL
jgi:NhaP-type Na+/H+ or K+/H+ antiporter